MLRIILIQTGDKTFYLIGIWKDGKPMEKIDKT